MKLERGGKFAIHLRNDRSPPPRRRSQPDQPRTDMGDLSSPSHDPETFAPDGGWGWVIVFCSFMIHFFGPGSLLSLGVMYVSWLEEFNSSRGLTSWVVSLAIAVFLTIGPLVAGVTSRFGYRAAVVLGGILNFTGFCLSFFATNIVMLIFCIGVVAGFGCGFCYLPAIGAVAVYFNKKRSFALGLATSGTGIGSFVQAPVYHWLILTYGWRGSLLVMGACSLNLCALGLLMRPLKRAVGLKRGISFEFGPPGKTQDASGKPQDASSKQTDAGDQQSENGFCPKAAGDFEEGGEEERERFLMVRDECVNGKAFDGDLAEVEELTGKRFFEEVEGLHHHDARQLAFANSELQKSPQVGSMSHIAFAVEKVRHTFSSETELRNAHNRSGISNNSLRGSHLAMDILMSGSMHSLSMIDRSSACANHQNGRATKSSVWEENARKARHEPKHKQCIRIFLSLFSNFALLKRPDFLLFIISNVLTNLSYLMPVLYMVDRAINGGIDKASAAMLVSLYGVGNVLGRLSCGYFGDRQIVDRTVGYIIVLCVCGVATCLSPLCGPSKVLHSLYAFTFGATIGGYTTLVPIVTVDIVGVSMVDQAYGIVLVFAGIPAALGPPLAGLIYDWTGDFTASFVLHGVFVVFSALFLLPVVLMKKSIRLPGR